jgi:hypothetical protein
MKKTVRLTESDLTRIIKRVIIESKKQKLNESLGISNDAKNLAEILIENIPRLKNESEILIDENINVLNIEEIIIRNRGGLNPYFNQQESIITPNRSRLVFGFSPNEQYKTVLHEAFHGVDYVYKKGIINNKLPHFTISTAMKLPALVSNKYKLGTLLYLLSDEEVKAHLHGAYAEGKEYYKTLDGTESEKTKKLFEYLNEKNYFYKDYFNNSSPIELLNKLSKDLLKQLTYGYYNENGENEYTMLLGVLNHYFKMKPKYNTVTDSQIEKFKKELSIKLKNGYNRFRNGLGRVVMTIIEESKN